MTWRKAKEAHVQHTRDGEGCEQYSRLMQKDAWIGRQSSACVSG